jgi:hypothetical protein
MSKRVQPIPLRIEEERFLKKNDINIVAFIIGLFSFLKNFDMCFLSGSFIFEDNNNKLFNLLTYGYINNTDEICEKDKALAKPHITITHNEVYKKEGVTSAESCFSLSRTSSLFESLTHKKCEDNKCFKMELIFYNKLQYLCDVFSSSLSETNISHKQVILYYRFRYNGRIYLFVKLEENPMNSLGHLKKFMDKKRTDTYDKRRENENSPPYEDVLKDKDDKFYKLLLDKTQNKEPIFERIDEYNRLLRTGRELFIFEELKELLFGKLLSINLRKLQIIIDNPSIQI